MTHDTPSGNPSENESPDWDALARRFAGESSPAEAAALDRWLDQHPLEQDALSKLEAALRDLSIHSGTTVDVEGALASVKARLRETGPHLAVRRGTRRDRRENAVPRWRVPIPAVAAAAVIAIGALTWASLRQKDTVAPLVIEQPRMLATGVGVRDSLGLPDGSRVILGPLSSVKVREGYGNQDREVEITGDAWFHVVHDESRPFTVFAGGARITDLGTRFMVRANPGGSVSVTVTEGAVSLARTNAPSPEAVTLQAGDNGTLGADGHIIASRGTVTEDDTAWLAGRLVFRETPVREVLPVIHRWYGIHLRIDDPSLMDRRITATFDGESAERMIQILRLVLNAEADLRGDTVALRSAGVKTGTR